MLRRSVLVVFLFCVVLPFVCAVAETVDERPDPVLTVGVLTTEDYVEGIGDIVIPLYFTGRGLFFLNPRSSMTDNRAEEYNLGVGYRHLLNSGDGLVGGNLFYDYRNTSRSARFDQVGAGVEYLSHFLDARANVYIPLNDKELVDEYSLTDESRVSGRDTAYATDWKDPYATGHDIYQKYEIIRTTRDWTTTTKTTRYFKQYEVALRGWDAEAGIRLPIEPIEDYLRLKLFGGYYHYQGKHGVDDVNGFRGRLELQLRPSVFVDAVYYSSDELTGGNFSLGVYASLPFDVANISKGRNPFAGAMETWEAGKLREDAKYRLTDMVKRDPQVRTGFPEPQEEEEKRTSASSTSSSTRQDTVDKGTATVATDITFVDGERANASDLNPGTFEEPKETVQGGVDDPRSMVFVFDTAVEYNEQVIISGSVNLRGSGCPIPAFGGKSYGSGVHPVINGGNPIGEAAIWVSAENTTVQGFEIMNALGALVTGNGIFDTSGQGQLYACNIIHDTHHGIFVSVLNDSLSVTLRDNEFIGNEIAGARIDGVGLADDFYFVHARDNTFRGGPAGLQLNANNYDEALAVLHGLDVVGAFEGINVALSARDLAVLSLTDISVQNNFLGVRANVTSTDGLAVLLGGTPRALLDLLNVAGPVPPELEALLTSGGPIQANNNFTGMDLVVNGDALAAMALFDVQATNNFMAVNANVVSPDGAALGLVASSENFAEVLQLGANVLDLLFPGMVPAIPASPMGPAQFNGNALGLGLSVNGRAFALASVVGVEARGNTVGNGVSVRSESADGPAIAALARIEAEGNALAGIDVGVQANNSLALAALFDVRSVNNTGDGVILNVTGDSAVGLLGSTDPLRSLADVLNQELGVNPPLEIPGAPFGPFVASDNRGNGILANIIGNELAVGVFLDIRANENDLRGIQADIRSPGPGGDAFGIFGSSDELFELIPPILGEILAGDVNAFPVPAYTPMGPMEASDNGNGGIRAIVHGTQAASLLAGGITANENRILAPFMGFGVSFDVESPDGSVFAGLHNIQGNDNVGMGIMLRAIADDEAIMALLNVEANDNTRAGIDVRGATTLEDLYLILAGVNTERNERRGIDAEFVTGRDLGVVFTDINSSDNLRHGLFMEATVGRNAMVWMGDGAVAALRAEFGDFSVMGASEALYGFMPQGPSTFINNGNDPGAPGARAGTRMDITAQQDLSVYVDGNTFSGNSGNGIHLDLVSVNANATAVLQNNVANDNNLNGMRVDVLASGAIDMTAHILLRNNVAMNNSGSGAFVDLGGARHLLYGEGNRFINNDYGIRSRALAGPPPSFSYMNFGEGLVGGNNALFGNTTADAAHSGVGTLWAQNNWWGADADPAGQTVGAVNSALWLPADPNP